METLSPLKYQMPAFGPYLLGQIGLVGNITLLCPPSSRMLLPYLLGQIGLVGNKKMLSMKFPMANIFAPLPIRSNRISWKTEKGFLLETLFLINCVKYILTKIDKNAKT